jgi:hypothetical protein
MFSPHSLRAASNAGSPVTAGNMLGQSLVTSLVKASDLNRALSLAQAAPSSSGAGNTMLTRCEARS